MGNKEKLIKLLESSQFDITVNIDFLVKLKKLHEEIIKKEINYTAIAKIGLCLDIFEPENDKTCKKYPLIAYNNKQNCCEECWKLFLSENNLDEKEIAMEPQKKVETMFGIFRPLCPVCGEIVRDDFSIHCTKCGQKIKY